MLDPATVQVLIQQDQVALSGVVPDQASVECACGGRRRCVGLPNVDPSGLSIGQTTWADGRVSLAGNALSNDSRPSEFTASLGVGSGRRSPPTAPGCRSRTSPAYWCRSRVRSGTILTADPIQFEPLSAEIQAESDDVLVQLAALLDQAPTAEFEVVGHTDSIGDEQENLLLSQERAQAVVDRLAELGVDQARMTSRGEGENSPIADNDTDEGRALNRRIAFVFIGLARPDRRRR